MSLPILSNSFFEQHRPSVELFQKWQSAASWSAFILPIYQWQDILYVGCSREISLDIKTDLKVVYIFCETEALNRLWEDFHFVEKKPELIELSSEVSEDVLDLENISEPASEALEGLDLGEPLHLGDNAEDNDILKSSTELDASSNENSDDLLQAFADVPPPVLEKTSVSITAVENSPTLQQIETPILATENKSEVSPLSVLKPKESPSNQVISASEAAPKPAIPSTPSAEALEVTRTVSSLTSLSGTHLTQEQVFSGIFGEMKKNFQKSMLLLKKQDTVIPWKWDENFQSSNSNQKKNPISLKQASPFRVVERTQKSYHGYVVPNDLNDQFFADWNGGTHPDHMTIIPIIIDDQIIAMLLGIGDKSADSKTCLLQTEHLSEAIAKKFKQQPQILKAA